MFIPIAMTIFDISKPKIDFLSKNLLLIFLFLFVSFLFAFYTYRKTFPPLSRVKKILLLTLRWIGLFCLFLALSGLVLNFKRVEIQKPVIAVLLDTSKSMNFKSGNITRKEILEEITKSDIFKKISTQTTLVAYTFSDTLLPFDLNKDLRDLSGGVTSIGDALEKAKKDLKERNLNAVVLLSDGANNYGKDPLFEAKSYGLPIYTSGIGEITSVKDIALEDIVYPDVAYSGKKIEIEVFLSNRGFEGLKLPLILKSQNRTLDQKNVELVASEKTQKIILETTPDQEGLFQYEVIIPAQKDESLIQNNKRVFSIKVLKSKIRVLFFASRLDWEYSFLKRFLSEDENVELKTLVYGKNQKPLEGKFPETETELSGYDLLIFLDFPSSIFARYKGDVTNFLKKYNKSVLFLLGTQFYEGKNLSDFSGILPFDFKGVDFFASSFNLVLTEEGKFHPVMKLADDIFENSSVWSNLPPFKGIVFLGNPDAKAKVLANYVSEKSTLPGIVVESNGGKIMVVTSLPLWSWDFLMWGIGKDNQAYKKFFQNSIRWLCTGEDVEKVQIKTDKLVYKAGERIRFEAKIFDENYEKIDNANVVINIKPQESALKESLSVSLNLNEWGNYSNEIASLTPSVYNFSGVAKLNDKILGLKSGEFTVEEYSLEDSDLQPNKDLLKKLSSLSGGKYYEPRDISSLVEDLKLETKRIEKIKKFQIWQSPFLLLVFIVCFSVEWIVRRRSQLL
jgi:hypothetical protein